MLLALAALAAGAVQWTHGRAYTLYYGDAEAHLNIARRIVDSRTPGFEQIGTVWLPLPHLLMAPFAGNGEWWHSGLAGALPAAACFALGAWLFFLALRRVLDSGWAAAAAVLALALNPNFLYLQALPMTESVFLACLGGLFYFLALHTDRPSPWAAAAAGLFALAGTMTRYEGWFLLPFAAFILLLTGGKRRWLSAAVFSLIAGAGPLYWLAHNWWFYGDALEFYHGQWSARAIYERSLAGGMERYPGDGNWLVALRYYFEAARLCAGWPMALLGLAGLAGLLWKKALWPLAILLPPPVFYVLSMHSSGTPVFVPHLWPYSFYNTRYGLAAFPLLAAGLAGLVILLPPKRRWLGVMAGAVACVSPWLIRPGPEAWVCWKESEVNSRARRAYIDEAADYLSSHYRGGGILISFGDLAGIFRQARIPLREALYENNRPLWDAAIARPDLFLREEWVVALAGDKASAAVVSVNRIAYNARVKAAASESGRDGGETAAPRTLGARYECVRMIVKKGAPVVEVYRRIQ